jgi:hypothetical protein
VGPLAYVPMQFAAAWLLDLLLRRQPEGEGDAAPAQARTPLPLLTEPHHNMRRSSWDGDGKSGPGRGMARSAGFAW